MRRNLRSSEKSGLSGVLLVVLLLAVVAGTIDDIRGVAEIDEEDESSREETSFKDDEEESRRLCIVCPGEAGFAGGVWMYGWRMKQLEWSWEVKKRKLFGG